MEVINAVGLNLSQLSALLDELELFMVAEFHLLLQGNGLLVLFFIYRRGVDRGGVSNRTLVSKSFRVTPRCLVLGDQSNRMGQFLDSRQQVETQAVALMTHLCCAGPIFRSATRMTSLGVASVNDWDPQLWQIYRTLATGKLTP